MFQFSRRPSIQLRAWTTFIILGAIAFAIFGVANRALLQDQAALISIQTSALELRDQAASLGEADKKVADSANALVEQIAQIGAWNVETYQSTLLQVGFLNLFALTSLLFGEWFMRRRVFNPLRNALAQLEGFWVDARSTISGQEDFNEKSETAEAALAEIKEILFGQSPVSPE